MSWLVCCSNFIEEMAMFCLSFYPKSTRSNKLLHSWMVGFWRCTPLRYILKEKKRQRTHACRLHSWLNIISISFPKRRRHRCMLVLFAQAEHIYFVGFAETAPTFYIWVSLCSALSKISLSATVSIQAKQHDECRCLPRRRTLKHLDIWIVEACPPDCRLISSAPHTTCPVPFLCLCCGFSSQIKYLAQFSNFASSAVQT